MSDEPVLLDPVAKAAEAVGGVTQLAKILNISRPAIYQWKRVPAERVIAIESATGGRVTRHQLRPDIYPEERSAA